MQDFQLCAVVVLISKMQLSLRIFCGFKKYEVKRECNFSKSVKNLQYKEQYKHFDVIQVFLNYLQFSNLSTAATVILKNKMLNEKFT